MEPIRVVARFKNMPEVPFLNEKRILLKNNQYALENQEDTIFRSEELFKLYRKGSLELANPEWGIQLMQEFSESQKENPEKTEQENIEIPINDTGTSQNTTTIIEEIPYVIEDGFDKMKKANTTLTPINNIEDSPYHFVTQKIKEDYHENTDVDLNILLNNLKDGGEKDETTVLDLEDIVLENHQEKVFDLNEEISQNDDFKTNLDISNKELKLTDMQQLETTDFFEELSIPKEAEIEPLLQPKPIPLILEEPLISETESIDFNINKEFSEVLLENKPSVYRYYTKQEFSKVYIGLSKTNLESMVSGYEIKTEFFDDKGFKTRRDTYMWSNPDGSYYSCDTQVGEVIQIHDNLKR